MRVAVTGSSGLIGAALVAGLRADGHQVTRLVRTGTPGYQAEIRDSRVQGTTALVRALAAMPAPPRVLLSGSAIGWYGDTGGREVTESEPAGQGFLPEVVRSWEAAAGEAAAAGIRVVTLRSGVVLSPRGGILGKLLPL